MPWEPPTVEEFNQQWVRPQKAAELLGPIIFRDSARQRYIMDRLKSGMIIAVARDHEAGGRRFRLVRIEHNLWNQCGAYGDDHFWETGDHTFKVGEYPYRYLDIRFPPDWFAGKGIPDDEPRPGGTNQVSDEQRPPLSKADAERFCRALLEGWGEGVTQDWAYEKAVLFFPEKKVARDTFRSILRSIRGPMKPGKRGKTSD